MIIACLLISFPFFFLYLYCRTQARTSQSFFRGNNVSTNIANEPEPPNLTNPKRVKKLTHFFGADPPLMRIFLRRLGYEVK